MRNNFYSQGTSIIAHHYFNDAKNQNNRVRYSTIGASSQPYIATTTLNRRKDESKDNPNGMIDGGGYQTQSRGNREQSATDKQTYTISSLGELEGPLRAGQSGQTLDLRDHQVSPEVYMALARGQKVEVELQQMAPERVNLFTPMLAAAMQIIGGAGGGVAYNEALTKVISGDKTLGGSGDVGQLGKAADFVNRHGSAYDLGLGTGEHIDVVAKFRILNEEKPNKPEQVVHVPPYVPAAKKKRDAEIPSETRGSEFREKPATVRNVTVPETPSPTPSLTPISYKGGTPPAVRTSPVDNGTELVNKRPTMADYNYRNPQGNGKTEDQNVHQFLQNRYNGHLGSSGKVNTLTSGKDGLAESSSTIRGLSPQSSVKNGSGANWYAQAIREGSYPVKAAEDFLNLAVKAGLITEKEFADAKGKPEQLGKLFENVEHKLGKDYNLRESGNLGSAHIRALENALIDKVQAMNGAATLTTISASQGKAGLEKINKYEACINSHEAEFKAIELEKDPAKREARRTALVNKIDNELKSLGFSESERNVLKYMSPTDVKNTNTELKNRGINLEKVASGDMAGLSDAVTKLEGDLQSVADTIVSSGYDSSNLPQFQQLKSQINAITGGKGSDTGSIDTLKSFIAFKSDATATNSALKDSYEGANLLNNIAQGKVSLPLSDEQKGILKKAGITDDKTINAISTGDLKAISEGLSQIQNAVPTKTSDGVVIEGASKLSTEIAGIKSYVDNKSSTVSRFLDNVLTSVQDIGEDEVVSESGKVNLTNAMNKIEQDLFNQIPKELRDTLAPGGKIDAEAVKKFLADPANSGKIDKSLSDNLTKFVDVQSKVNELKSRTSLGGGHAEYNLPIGAREYIDPLIKDLESKGVDLSFLKDSKGNIDYTKVPDFLSALQSVTDESSIGNAQAIYQPALTKILTLEPKDTKTKENSPIEMAKHIKRNELDRTQDQEAVDVIGGVNGDKGYKLKPKPGIVDIKTSPVTTTASAVRINSETLKDKDIMRMTQDFLKMGVKAGLITEQQLKDAGSDPKKIYELFTNVENKLNAKYNPGLGQRTLTTDGLFGAAHITNIQRALVDATASVRKGAQALDKLYEGQNLSTTQTQDLQSLVDDYNNSEDVKTGKKPKIESIDQLKNDKNLATGLLDFAAGKLTEIKNSIPPEFEQYGQLGELKQDIDRVIGKAGGDSGILAVKSVINESSTSDAPADTKGNAREYKEGLEKTLSSMRQALANGQTTISVDDDGDGKGDRSIKISDYIKKLETDYQNFLLNSTEDEHSGIESMAKLFSQVHFEAGLAGANDAYNEISTGFALALESVGNVNVDAIFGTKPGQSTVSDSKDLTHRMIGNITVNKLRDKFDDCFDENTGKADPKKLLGILSANFKNFNEQQALEFFAISERLLKQAGVNPVPDLSGDFQKARKAGQDVTKAMESVLKGDNIKPALDKLKELSPSMGALRESVDSFDGTDKSTVADRLATTPKGDGVVPPKGDGVVPPKGDGVVPPKGDGVVPPKGDGELLSYNDSDPYGDLLDDSNGYIPVGNRGMSSLA